MRVSVALVVVGVSLCLSGCSRPPQAKSVRSKWVPPSQQSVPKFTKATAVKTLKKPSRPVSKRSKKFKTHLVKPARPQIKAPASADMRPPLPPRKPELAPATDAESSPPLPPRKPQQTPDSREHAIPEAEFMAAKEKAKREGVHSLTTEDVRGLSQEQIKELRGY
jgi:hypothetical protein